MKNGWTGGQYSLVRAILGTYLLVHFVHLIPWAAELFSNQGVLPDGRESPLLSLFPNLFALWDGPAFVTAVVACAAGLSVLFILGWHDRPSAVLLWYIWACLHGRMPLIANPGMPYIGWLLLVHACLPSAPYGSLAARGRLDPGGGWRMPPCIFLAAWIVMALGYTYSGLTKLTSPSWIDGSAMTRVLENPLARPGWLRETVLTLPPVILQIATWGGLAAEVAFAPLALFRRLRPWIWSMLLLMHLGLIILVDFTDLSLGMIMLHLFTFDPGWIKPQTAAGTSTLFYDGACGFCHGAVRFVLAEDRSGDAFRFAPLHGATFGDRISADKRRTLPDSLVVLTAESELLIRGAAAQFIAGRLGGIWRVFAILSKIVPRPILNLGYRAVAGVRKRLTPRPLEACPMLTPALRGRFDE